MIIELPPEPESFDSDSEDSGSDSSYVEPPPVRIDMATAQGRIRLIDYATWAATNDALLEFTYVYQQFQALGQEIAQTKDDNVTELARFYDEIAEHFLARLVTKLLYDAMRHSWDGDECSGTRYDIAQLNKNFEAMTRKEYAKWIHDLERDKRDFWGDDISDDSDSDDESVPFRDDDDVDDDEDDESHPLPDEENEVDPVDQVDRTYRFADDGLHPGGTEIREQMPAPNAPFRRLKSFMVLRDQKEWSQRVGENAAIHYDDEDWTEQAVADLDAVNLAITKGQDVEKAALHGTRFCVAQYRGIAYNVISFGAAARRANRATYELLLPVYASSVFHQCGVSPGDFYAGRCEPQIADNLAQTAANLRDTLVAKRFTDPIRVGPAAFANQAFALQDFYTKSYDGFHRELDLYFSKTKEGARVDLWPCFEGLLNAKNPFVSTGNTPRHALRYAYGLKFYEGHEHERLRPRWRASGRAERPYAGKVYISLHPVDDYLFGGPLDVVALNRSGNVSVVSLIAAERESSFPAFIPAERVIAEHVARYPSFAYEYRPYFVHKYGLLKEEYDFFRKKIVKTQPHSKSHRDNKKTLGEWLVRYYEARLVEIARRHAKAMGMLLVYRDENGFLTRVLPSQVGPVNVSASRDSSGSGSDSDSASDSMGASNKISSRKRRGLELPQKPEPPKIQQSKKLKYEMVLQVERTRYRFFQWVRQRFVIRPVPGDGNCLFHALARALPAQVVLPVCQHAGIANMLPLSHVELRKLAVWQLREEKRVATLLHPAPDGNIDDADLAEMDLVADDALQYGRWGTDREVGAVVRALAIAIRIYSPTDIHGHRDVTAVGPAQPAALLLHGGGNHWDWLTIRDDRNLAVLNDDFAG